MENLEYGEHVCKPIRKWVNSIAKILKTKPTVTDVEIIQRDILKIKRKRFNSDIVLYVVDAYVLGEGATLEIIENNPEINCILVCSNWNQYTESAKKLAKEYKVGLFTLSELMGAIYYNGRKFIEYEPPKKNDRKF